MQLNNVLFNDNITLRMCHKTVNQNLVGFCRLKLNEFHDRNETNYYRQRVCLAVTS